jgi:alkane 1-monooxygenase
VLYVGFLFLINHIYGLKGVAYTIAQGHIGVLMLELVNYIEHYGLSREKLENGEYEQVDIRHSWNAPYVLTNYLFLKL